jgi:hypothetical protein
MVSVERGVGRGFVEGVMMSKKDPWYRQCTYEMPTEEGKKVDVSWIPEKFAKVGKKIYFGKRIDSPEELWTVVSVGGRQKESYLVERMMDYKHQRKMSDI